MYIVITLIIWANCLNKILLKIIFQIKYRCFDILVFSSEIIFKQSA